MAKLFLNRIFNKCGPPIHLIWFITAKCNLRCSHCFFHRNIAADKDELSFGEIEKTIQRLSPLLSISLTGGEPFLREDLVDISRLLEGRKTTQNIMLFSNGYNSEAVLEKSEKILSGCPKTNIFINISLDGFEKEHDKYRNREGSYKRAAQTIKGLKELEAHFSNLNVGICTTLHSNNQKRINELRDDIYIKFGISPGINIIRGEPYLPELKDVDASFYKGAIKAIEHDRRKLGHASLRQAMIATREILGYKLAYETFIKHSRLYDCYAGSLMGIIYENGDVYPCEMLPDAKLGNLRDHNYDLNKIWGSRRAQETRQFIKTRKCFCTYECQYTCNTAYNVRFLPVFIGSALKYFIDFPTAMFKRHVQE